MIYALIGKLGGAFVRLPILPGQHTLGRGPQNDLRLEHASVSRRHAEILFEGGQLRLRDAGSSNGTWQNDTRVADWVDLRAGDRLRFGRVELWVWTGASADDIPHAAPPAALTYTTSLEFAEAGDVLAGDRLSLQAARAEFHAATVDEKLFRAVTDAGNLLVMLQPLPQVFDHVLALVAEVVPARRIVLLLTDTPDGTPVPRAARPATALTGDKLMLSRTLTGTVLRDRESLLLNDARSDPRFAGLASIIHQRVCSAMVAPLFDNAQVIGLLYADSDDPRVHYDREQLRAFTLLANLIAVQITTARLMESERERERMAQEVAAAADVQRNLLPACLPDVPGYELAASQLACYEVAGDLYEVTRIDDGRVAFAVGDVTGKGLGAALLMANVMAALRVLLQECPRIAACADRMHRELLQSTGATRFVTLFFGLLDPATGHLEYVNAGHNPPLLFTPDGGVRELAATGLPLGLLEGATYTTDAVTLPPGALLCVYSDGIPEAAVGEELYGDERLRASLRRHEGLGAAELLGELLNDVRAFLAGESLNDDVTLLLLRRLGAATDPPGARDASRPAAPNAKTT
jgi:sigma-B regulation protein RsbU (phosphoserine phosphatase)